MPESRPAKPRRTKVREVKQEVQTVKTRLDSPTGPKIRRKGPSEPTMTFHSKAATNDIYDMFNQPLKKQELDESGDDADEDEDNDTYSTAGESTGTGRISAATSEFGDDTLASIRTGEGHTASQPTSVSPWSEFTASKHMPKLDSKGHAKSKHRQMHSDDMTDNMPSSQNPTQTSGMGNSFDTQAIEALANQDFGDDLDTKAIAMIAGGDEEADEAHVEEEPAAISEDLKTPVEPAFPDHVEVHNKPRYVPLPPEDYEPTPIRPYRDPDVLAQNKLPFMTPIVERTESSLASTVFKDGDYFNTAKTPSRSVNGNASKYDSPSKLKLDQLLMSSPEKESPSSTGKRRLSQAGASEEEVWTSSPRKQKLGAKTSPIKKRDEKPPDFTISKETEVKNEVVKTQQEQAVVSKPRPKSKGPIITDLQCNPCDPTLRQQILDAATPSISEYAGYNESADSFNHHSLLKSYAARLAKEKKPQFSPRKSQNGSNTPKVAAPVLNFNNKSGRVYVVKRELGKGAFAPVYLVESTNADDEASTTRGDLEAVKSESPASTLTWEFHILRLVHARLPPSTRILDSIIKARECHIFADEAYLTLDYLPQGTLLDLMNAFKAENARQGKSVDGTGLDEGLAIFFAVELVRTVLAVHEAGVIHGDLKGDNCLVRFDPAELSASYDRTGQHGWAAKGIKLIDFGRGIDVDESVFDKRVKFMADWEAHPEECWEVREGRLWKWVVDWWGVAGVVHCLLFGKYLDTIPVVAAGPSRSFIDDDESDNDHTNTDGVLGDGNVTMAIHSRKQYRPREPFKRYWEKELWTEIFRVLLNMGQEDDGGARGKEMRKVQRVMEDYLEAEGERGGRDLRGSVRRGERIVGARK